jgi:glutathione S-transferase
MKLVVGNYTYSSWSMRSWLLMRHVGIDFETVRIPLFTDETEALIEKWCPAKQVPVLHDGPLVLWDSLAICEYIADKWSDAGLWPESAENRARARAMCSEMHAGFKHVRRKMPMNCRRTVTGFTPDLDTRIEINRLVQLFEDALQASSGPWLYGRFGVVDAMFAPIASRLTTYGVRVPDDSTRWVKGVLAHPAVVEWYQLAKDESEIIEPAEIADA